jgi:hypothetical protein
LNPFRPVFSWICATGGQVSSDGNSLPVGLKPHQEPTRSRDHGHHEARPGIRLGRTNRLAEIAESSMHLTGAIADPQQNHRTCGMMSLTLIHVAQLPDRRDGRAVPIGLLNPEPCCSRAYIDVCSQMTAPSVMIVSLVS